MKFILLLKCNNKFLNKNREIIKYIIKLYVLWFKGGKINKGTKNS